MLTPRLVDMMLIVRDVLILTLMDLPAVRHFILVIMVLHTVSLETSLIVLAHGVFRLLEDLKGAH